jgi:predicted nucleotidyltransferase
VSRVRYDDAMVDPAIPAIRQFLRGRTDVRLAVVFGSRARGTATPASDVDVAVDAPGVDVLGLGADLSRVTGHEVDVVALEDASARSRGPRDGPAVVRADARCVARARGVARRMMVDPDLVASKLSELADLETFASQVATWTRERR